MSDVPNKGLGFFKTCYEGKLFIENTWNSAFCDGMIPQRNDVICYGKRGPNAFLGSNLEHILLKHNIETVAIGGFLADCCVDSTMRNAYEKGFNVITLTD